MMKTQLIITTLLAALILPATADLKQEIRELSREKRNLTREVGKLFQEKKLNHNEEYRAAQEKAFIASREFTKTRKAHPKLKDLYAKSDAAQKKMINASVNGDKEASKKARDEFTSIRMELEKVAREIPELKESQQKAIDANKAAQEKEKELLASIPEGKALIDKINALDAKIAELRKKMLATP